MTFSADGADLRITSNAIGATGHTATNFTWTSGGTGTVVGAINDGVVAGVDAVAEALNIEETVSDGSAGGGTAAAVGDQLQLTANGVTYTTAALAAVAQSDIAAALNAAQDADGNRFDALFTAFAGDGTYTATAGDEIEISSNTAGTTGAFTLTNYTILRGSDQDTMGGGDGAAAIAFGVANGPQLLTEGNVRNAYEGAVHTSATRTSTYPNGAVSDLRGNFGAQTSTETSSAKNTITLAEAATVKFGTDAMSSALQNYMLTTGNTGGTFTLSGTDKASFEITQILALLKTK